MGSKMDLRKAFGSALTMHRARANLSQQSFAAAVQREHISRLERGISIPNLASIDEIAGVLGIHPLTLLAQCYALKSGKGLTDMLKEIEAEFIQEAPEH